MMKMESENKMTVRRTSLRYLIPSPPSREEASALEVLSGLQREAANREHAPGKGCRLPGARYAAQNDLELSSFFNLLFLLADR